MNNIKTSQDAPTSGQNENTSAPQRPPRRWRPRRKPRPPQTDRQDNVCAGNGIHMQTESTTQYTTMKKTAESAMEVISSKSLANTDSLRHDRGKPQASQGAPIAPKAMGNSRNFHKKKRDFSSTSTVPKAIQTCLVVPSPMKGIATYPSCSRPAPLATTMNTRKNKSTRSPPSESDCDSDWTRVYTDSDSRRSSSPYLIPRRRRYATESENSDLSGDDATAKLQPASINSVPGNWEGMPEHEYCKLLRNHERMLEKAKKSRMAS
ncbi:hypothetical protein EDC01DRAFT_650132 [Geopyxis carbonaria]|nr:hypothetical protein EDC01DRAFT_650132 [Geopyxis carbonaria]